MGMTHLRITRVHARVCVWKQVRDSVFEAIAEIPESWSLRPDMEGVVQTMVDDIARNLVAVREESTLLLFFLLYH